MPTKARELASTMTDKAAHFADAHLPTAIVKSIVAKTLDGTLELTFNPALRSANAQNALRGYEKKHQTVRRLEDLKKLDLEDLDRFRRRKGLYVTTSAAQGTVTALAVTGTVVSSTVSGGVTAGAVVAAVAADTVASLAMMGRSVGSVAVRYGYDVRLPDEELFAMGVLSFGMAGTLEAKHTALAALSRLTQQMMRGATWKQLNEQVLVRVIGRVYQVLGFLLTKRKLAQTVPFVGVGINAALSANMTRHVYQRAEDIYRIRFLSEKYGLDPQAWLQDTTHVHDDPESGTDLPDVAEILDEERQLMARHPKAT
ncbi:EcsC family protein [Microbispora bryophytorum]|uniref:EcsC family protein n=1 Tax=Microbispora bryophytorum TaxID=1460882 RepID=UPI0033C199CC